MFVWCVGADAGAGMSNYGCDMGAIWRGTDKRKFGSRESGIKTRVGTSGIGTAEAQERENALVLTLEVAQRILLTLRWSCS